MSAVMIESPRELAWKRFAHMKNERRNWDSLFIELRDTFIPNRGRFEGDKNKRIQRVSMLNSKPAIAVRTMASGLHAGLTSPARPWQKSTIREDDLGEFGPVRDWLAIVDDRMMRYYTMSGLYQALPFMYAEYGTMGIMGGMLFEDDKTLFRVEPYTIGSYYVARSDRGEYDTMYRVVQMTVRQIVSRFGSGPLGMSRLSAEIRSKWANADQRETNVDVLHTVEPGEGGRWVSSWWEMGRCETRMPLKVASFTGNPVLAASWEYIENEAYPCNCPGMIARGDAKALQVDERRKSQAIERNDNPAMQGPVKATNVNLSPGAYNQVDAMQATGQNGGIRRIYDQQVDISGRLENLRERERRIDTAFYVDLFLMLTMDDRRQPSTAEEIRAKYDEKVLALGPTLEQANVMLRGLHSFVFDLMVRKSMPIWRGVIDGDPILPKPPAELLRDGVEIEPEFISALQQAQKAQQLQGLERFASMAGNIATMTQRLPEKLDTDQFLDEYGTALGVNPRVVRDDEEVAQMREQQAQADQMAQMAQMAPALRDAAGAMKDASGAVPQDGSVLQSLAGAMADQSGMAMQ